MIDGKPNDLNRIAWLPKELLTMWVSKQILDENVKNSAFILIMSCFLVVIFGELWQPFVSNSRNAFGEGVLMRIAGSLIPHSNSSKERTFVSNDKFVYQLKTCTGAAARELSKTLIWIVPFLEVHSQLQRWICDLFVLFLPYWTFSLLWWCTRILSSWDLKDIHVGKISSWLWSVLPKYLK